MADNENEGLKAGENDTPGNQPNPTENGQGGSEPLENSGEEKSPAEKADELLSDGTLADKEIRVNKKSYDEKAKKAELYETHAVLIDKIIKNPELVESLLETKERGNLDERIGRIEEERKEEKRREIRAAVTEALGAWTDFEKLWPEIQPITDSLAKRGVPYQEALRRGYFAVNPEAAAAEKERVAREGENIRGTFSGGASFSPKPIPEKKKRQLSDIERRVAQALGKKEEEYAALLEKHEGWLKSHGFETELD